MLVYFAVSYLLGSIPFGYILLRVFRGEDVRQHGSGNIGATNVARKAPGLGVATLVLDALKGYAAVMLAMILNPATFGWAQQLADTMPSQPNPATPTSVYVTGAIAAVFAILGHVFPVWLKF